MLEIENFGEYLKPQVIPLYQLGLGLTFVRAFNRVEPALGSNGGGKSTMWDAFTWCLFGRTLDGRRGTDIRPWAKPKAHAYVAITAYINDRKTRLERSTEPNGLWIDGKVVNQERVEEVFGLSFMLFSNSIVFGQSEPLFFDLKPGEKLKLLSDVIGLDRWNSHVKSATKRTALYDTALTQADAQLRAMEDTIKQITADIVATKTKMNEWDSVENAKHEASTKGLQADRDQLEKLRVELGKLDLDYDGAETELRHANTMLDKARADHSVAITKWDSASSALLRADDAMNKLKDEAKHMGTHCPSCGQRLDGPGLKKHKAELRDRIISAEDDADVAYRNTQKYAEVKEATSAVIAKWQSDVATYRTKSDAAIDGRTRVQTRVSELAAIVRMKEDAGKAKQTNPHDETLQALRARRDKADAIADEAAALVKLTTAKHGSNKFWINGFKQVRLYLLEEFLNELEVVTLNMLPRLGLIGWTVRLSIEREKKDGDTTTGLSVQIGKPGMDQMVKWESWSGGEAQRLRIAGALALSETLMRRAGVTTDLIVLDEPTRGLSPEGVADLVDALVEFAHDRQVILIDHTARESKRMAHILTVERDAATGSRVLLD